MRDYFTYRGEQTKEISFPLGGIGTGSIGLCGNGRLADWEIFNRPNKNSLNGYTHFLVKAERAGRVLDVRCLQGDLTGSYTGNPTENLGQGVSRGTMAGLPHFAHWEFQGEFPMAELTFWDEHFPGKVKLRAMNPLIPSNSGDSSLPAAFFRVEVENGEEDIDYTVVFSVSNPVSMTNTRHGITVKNSTVLLRMGSGEFPQDSPSYGDLTIAAAGTDISYQEHWYRGAWFDSLSTFWKEAGAAGRFKNRSYPANSNPNAGLPTHQWVSDTASLAVHFSLEPCARKSIPFVLAWSFPNFEKYWGNHNTNGFPGMDKTVGTQWKNYYATVFQDSQDCAAYCLEHGDRLWEETERFHDALFGSSMPDESLDAAASNLAVLKSPCTLRLEDGSFYGWEGCNASGGSCEGSCTHVWNYAYALPFLFPDLERSMRTNDFRYNQQESGAMSFRLQLPLGSGFDGFRACADGQLGGVFKAYRDWKLSGDTPWLQSLWPRIKKSLEYAWSTENPDAWDRDKDGILEGRQHHTLDMELFGPNSWLTGFYLLALECAAEMAQAFGEQKAAEEYQALFQSGKEKVNGLFNGEYFIQKIDLNDKEILSPFVQGGSILGISTEEAYWNSEAGELKHQIGDGCMVDQVIAQWHANLCGAGRIFDQEKTKSALRAIYQHNFKKDFREWFNPCRIFALNGEAGTVICDWPQGTKRPVIGVPYAEECFTGCEYQAAAHMIQEGLVAQGETLVKAVRARYDGAKRNPFNEMECGSNYARSMSSFSLVQAYSGFACDKTKETIGFDPTGQGCYFWSLDGAWGVAEFGASQGAIRVLYGRLALRRVIFGGRYFNSRVVELSERVCLEKGSELTIEY